MKDLIAQMLFTLRENLLQNTEDYIHTVER